jgi:hypothetical protein
MRKISSQISCHLELNWKSYDFSKFNKSSCQVVKVLTIWGVN